MPPIATETISASMREFLLWVAFRERTYTDAMEAWQSHCPRFTQWEDALDAAFISVDENAGSVRLTELGQGVLNRCR